MADVANREDLEAQIARLVGRVLGSQRKQIVEWLGDPPKAENITAERWEELAKEMRGALGPELQKLFISQAEAMLADVPAGVDWALVNKAAADWASRYTFELVKGITDNSRAALQSAVSAYFEQGQTIGQLEDAIAPTFGPVRAEAIAVTEVTRAAMEGEAETVKELAAEGIEMVAVWQTRNDELVCTICGPRHNKKQGDGWDKEEPAHPRCRCWVNHELVKA